MATAKTTPTNIEPTEDGSALRIEWKDGHASVYEPRRLRLHCPCAGCVDEVTGRRTLTSAMVPENVYPQAIHYVGRYALQFIWSDGHQTGFYTYDLLRSLCDCEICGSIAE
ncbi:MAG: hypothetical protein BMS9Abin29_0993 [Gemmatimonadota bacterium]|nr:MAG: hypothetical protein BMS9Abin29_0993 [Gemmatimonadota bacterium]